jgi:hypothetical protein
MNNCTLETIDKSIENLLIQKPKTKIDFWNDVKLKCDGLKWMAKYVDDGQLTIHGSRCADKGNELLSDYLKSSTKPMSRQQKAERQP